MTILTTHPVHIEHAAIAIPAGEFEGQSFPAAALVEVYLTADGTHASCDSPNGFVEVADLEPETVLAALRAAGYAVEPLDVPSVDRWVDDQVQPATTIYCLADRA